MSISIPYSFTANTDILSAQVNANFSELTNALDKRGDTLTGNLTVSSGITIDGVDISAVLGTGGTLPAVNGSSLTNLNASNLASGTVPDARFPATLPAASGANLTALNATNLDSGTVSDSRLPTTIAGKTLTTPELTNYRETKATGTISTNTLALDLNNGNHFAVSLTANITTFTVSNVPTSGKAAAVVVVFTADGTLRTITWPSGTVWAGGTAPTMTSTNNKRDIVSLYTFDGGTVWFGVVVGQNF
jgi:hypothetical protein